MKILVTGAAGYIGSTLCEELLVEGHSVVAYDNFMWDVPSLAACCAYPNFKLVRGDVRDMPCLAPHLKLTDVFIPLAALVGAPLCDQRVQDTWDVNCHAVRNAVEYLDRSWQRVIIPVTNSGYGVGGHDECTEDSPLKPISHYGKSKVEAEGWVMGHPNAVSLRLATVFGASPRMRWDLLVNDLVWRAVRDRSIVLFEAHFRRNFIHVRDVAGAFIHMLRQWENLRGRVYNVGLSTANVTKMELCKRIQTVVPCEIILGQQFEDPDKRDYLVSNARIEATGWRPQYSLEAGIIELAKAVNMYSIYGDRGNV